MKTSEKQMFIDLFRGYQIGTLGKNGLNFQFSTLGFWFCARLCTFCSWSSNKENQGERLVKITYIFLDNIHIFFVIEDDLYRNHNLVNHH